MSRTPLFAAMVAHGIPTNKTAVIADELELTSLADLAEMRMFDLVFADAHFRGRLVALRNAHKPAGAEDWPIPDDGAWPAIGTAFCGTLLATFAAQTGQAPGE
jgi:hypothetical protein